MSDAEFDAFVKELFGWYVDWDPIFATSVGVHRNDALLPKGTYEAVGEETGKAREALRRLEAFDRKSLSPSKRVDRGVLRNALRLWIFQNDELRIWESRPAAAEDLGNGLFLLFMRNFAPLPERMASITGRLERAPRFLRETKSRVRTPTRLWAEIGLESVQQAPAFLDIVESAGREALAAPDTARLREAVGRTKEALADQEAWIQADLLPKSQDKVGIGAAKFRRLVALRELGLTVDAIYAIGKRFLRESRRELQVLAKQIPGGGSVAKAKEAVKGDHPADWKGALDYTAQAMEDAKRYILEHDLATIPSNEVLRVIETPTYLRHLLPFAAYNPPGHFDPVQEGLYMVTPYEDKPEMLRENSYAGTRNTAVHEGYPGHHLQLSAANLNPSLARLFSYGAVESVEGWAHYCEQMMKEKGFGDDPATRFAQMLDQLWRAARILIDVDLHCGRMTFDQAVDFLVTECGFERAGAIGEVKRYSYTPAYPLSYLTGKHLILSLRRDVKKGLGRQYSDKFFHDTYLYAGSIPMRYMREIFEYKIRELQKLRKQGL
jgi:uncharacterized protein (DUF885 family)